MKTAAPQCPEEGNPNPTDMILDPTSPPVNGCMMKTTAPSRISPRVPICDGDDLGSEDESETCTICFEPYSDSGDHRLSSLKCGHIFGQSCIQDYLRSGSSKCPMCNAKAKEKHIRPIYALMPAKRLKKERALRALEEEHMMALEEPDRLKAQDRQQSSPVPASQPASQFQRAAPTLPGCYVPEKTISVSLVGGSRVLAYDHSDDVLVASVPLPSRTSGFGVRKIRAFSKVEFSEEVPIHSKPIRCLKFSGRNDGRLLTGAMDKMLKITSLFCDTVMQTFITDSPVWSCCWNEEDANYVYAGLTNGTILLYDTRNASREVLVLRRDGIRCPIVELNYVPATQGVSSSSPGLLVATVKDCSFWEQTSVLDYRPSVLPSLQGNCISLSFEPRTRHCLASFRQNNSMKHVTCELSRVPNVGQMYNPIRTFIGASRANLLSRSAIFGRPNSDNHLLIAAGYEGSSSLHIWDSSSGTEVQRLKTGATVLDVTPFRFKNVDYLAALSERVVHLYKWQV